MAVPGAKFNLPKDVIVTVLKESKGVISRAAKSLDIAPFTLRKHIKKYPDIVTYLEELRHDFDNLILDMAENCVAVAMSKMEDDPTSALKSAFFTLNSRGQERGWSNTLGDQNKNQKITFEVNYPAGKNTNDSVEVSPETVSTPDTSSS